MYKLRQTYMQVKTESGTNTQYSWRKQQKDDIKLS